MAGGCCVGQHTFSARHEEFDSDNVSELEPPGGRDRYLQDSEHNLGG